MVRTIRRERGRRAGQRSTGPCRRLSTLNRSLPTRACLFRQPLLFTPLFFFFVHCFHYSKNSSLGTTGSSLQTKYDRSPTLSVSVSSEFSLAVRGGYRASGLTGLREGERGDD